MIAEESAKWAEAFARCASKRELDALLLRIGEFQRMAVRPGQEPYEEIGRRLGLDEHTDAGQRFHAAVGRLVRRRHHA